MFSAWLRGFGATDSRARIPKYEYMTKQTTDSGSGQGWALGDLTKVIDYAAGFLYFLDIERHLMAKWGESLHFHYFIFKEKSIVT